MSLVYHSYLLFIFSLQIPTHLHDVIYITCLVQLTSIISRKFRWIYAVIPAFAVYKGWGLIKGFLPQGCEGVEEDEKTRKKREKMEKKASRGKFVKAKAR
ncbi:putative SRP-independent targeting protein 2/TMEM208 [Helianthus annuus]|nr:putative SRP-independent targeting protein 2/TMEM208 [Helianthus annuus]